MISNATIAKKGEKKNTESYTGGNASGMAVENADDIEGIMAQAQKGSEARASRGGDEKGPDHEVRITMFKNGFQVEGGEFREYDTPENKEFISELNKGYIPKELREKYKSMTLGVALEDKRGENYRPPTPPPYTAYSGEGTGLGGTQGTGGAVDKNST